MRNRTPISSSAFKTKSTWSKIATRHLPISATLDQGAPAIPRRHGLIGEVEIELDQVSPAVLIARAAGQLFERSEPR